MGKKEKNKEEKWSFPSIEPGISSVCREFPSLEQIEYKYSGTRLESIVLVFLVFL